MGVLSGTAGAQTLAVDSPAHAMAEVASNSETEQTWIQIFGVRLHAATREEMRQALRAQGMKVVREDDRYWVDIYDAKGVLHGATQFYVG